METNHTDIFREQPPTDEEMETFKKFLNNYKIGDIKSIVKTRLKNQSSEIRILVAGDVGSGKSSFVKTLLELCGNQRDARFLTTGAGGASLRSDTATLKYYRLTETTATKYFICDTPGFPSDLDISMRASHVKRFVDGYVRKGEAISYPCNMVEWFFSRRYADSTMDAVIFIARPPLNVSEGKCRLNSDKLAYLKKMRQALEMTLGCRPFFFVITATDLLKWTPEDTVQDIFESFDGCSFVVGKREKGMCMPSVAAYTELIKGIFGSIEEYRLNHET
ncbi:hypothetical protein BC936DRAFT_142013 [Jimgerdemannia flammicorona]|uniref:Uncharacterized protein n=2 Tax=Jimgerdemannia flammicorona TaxID=994334 RepID=A0A433DFK4_9FUNG|nr:hypothetical protein BC936DRAFT_142013 [Jimgerdemannia flammicorona]RUS34550.1 hypothetical protein BC938DRAFT_479741 [Jimgerdemannia flammicorona]